MALGISTIFYTLISTLINPADAKRHVLGVDKSDLVSMMADILVELEFRHALVVHGLDGLDEIAVIGKTSVAEVKDGWAKKYEVTPADFGLPTYTYEALLDGDPQQNAELVRALLAGTEQGARRAMVIANAAAALRVGGKAPDLGSGARLAAALIDSGAAHRKLDELIAASNRLAAEGR